VAPGVAQAVSVDDRYRVHFDQVPGLEQGLDAEQGVGWLVVAEDGDAGRGDVWKVAGRCPTT
jgi:hypothetical protein